MCELNDTVFWNHTEPFAELALLISAFGQWLDICHKLYITYIPYQFLLVQSIMSIIGKHWYVVQLQNFLIIKSRFLKIRITYCYALKTDENKISFPGSREDLRGFFMTVVEGRSTEMQSCYVVEIRNSSVPVCVSFLRGKLWNATALYYKVDASLSVFVFEYDWHKNEGQSL